MNEHVNETFAGALNDFSGAPKHLGLGNTDRDLPDESAIDPSYTIIPDEAPDPSEVRTCQRRRILAEAGVPELVRAAEYLSECCIALEVALIHGDCTDHLAGMRSSARAVDRLGELINPSFLDPDIAALMEKHDHD